MLRRILTSLWKDTLINLRNGFYLVTLLVAVIYLVGVRWVIPADTTVHPRLYIVDQTATQRFATHARAQAGDERAVVLVSVDELRERMARDTNSIGVALAEGDPLPEATLYFQGHESDRVRNLLAVSLEAELRVLYGAPRPTDVPVQERLLRAGGAAAPIPFNLALVPVLLFTDAAMIGLVFVAALIFSEKTEGTLRAFLVTPGRTWEYLLAKALSLAIPPVILTLILVAPTVGARAHYGHLLAVIVAGSMLTTLIGAAVAIYYDNISQFLPVGILAMVVLGMPSVSYFVPGFSPAWLRLLPSYPIVFGLREALFPTNNPQTVYTALLYLVALNAVMLAVSSMTIRRQIVRS